jgi:hypothetical protein
MDRKECTLPLAMSLLRVLSQQIPASSGPKGSKASSSSTNLDAWAHHRAHRSKRSRHAEADMFSGAQPVSALARADWACMIACRS